MIDPRNKKAFKTVGDGWTAVANAANTRPEFYQRRSVLTERKVRDRYETLEGDFKSLYLNPGTNGSDKQDLTPLQVILKKTAEAKDLAAENCRKSAKDKAAKKKQLGDLEKQFRMQGPSPTKTVDASASSSSSFTPQSEDEFEIRTVRGAAQCEFQRLSSEEVEREFVRLSPQEMAKFTPEERGEY